jgi:hypothetical protein
MRSDTLLMAAHVYHALSFYFRCFNSEPHLLLCSENLVCNIKYLWDFYVM